MKILVTVKRVIDYNVQVRVKSDGSGVETENVKMLADYIVSLDRAGDQLSKHLNILVDPDSITNKEIDELYKIAEQYQGDTRLVFHIPKNGKHQQILAHNIRVSTDSKFCNKLKRIYGKKNIWIE